MVALDRLVYELSSKRRERDRSPCVFVLALGDLTLVIDCPGDIKHIALDVLFLDAVALPRSESAEEHHAEGIDIVKITRLEESGNVGGLEDLTLTLLVACGDVKRTAPLVTVIIDVCKLMETDADRSEVRHGFITEGLRWLPDSPGIVQDALPVP